VSKGILWGVVQEPVNVAPRYPVGQPHHITLRYGVDRDDWNHLEGLEIEAIALYEAWNNRIQAIAVKLPAYIPCQNRYPHISVSWKTGVAPVESNLMLSTKYRYQLMSDTIKLKTEFLEWTTP
jgi:hypothetical protein